MIQFDIDKLNHSLDEVRALLDPQCRLHLGEESKKRIAKCRNYLDERMKNQKAPIYGVTTGFGSLCNVSVDKDQLSQLQKNLVMSHSCGVGEEVRPEIVRLMIALKVKSLSYGYSGVRVETVERLVDFFNEGITPVVYQQGSLGASGDLAPLANMCLPLLGLGEFDYKGKRYPGSELEKMFGWKPLTLASKEGLALLNGTQFMLAHAVWCIIRAEHISAAADKIATVSLEAFNGRKEPFTPGVHAVRPHKGQIETARVILGYLQGSQLIDGPGKEVQDPYSFRCVPQVHGASKDAIAYVESVFMTEVNSATDNPGSISERRTYQLISGKRGLPSFLVAKSGLNSGFMIPQYAAASVVSQNKQLCTPCVVDTIDSSQGQEDHVSMGANAATKCVRVVENVEKILGIEMLNAAQALEFRHRAGAGKSSPVIEKFFEDYRKEVPFIEEDTVMYSRIKDSIDFIRKAEF